MTMLRVTVTAFALAGFLGATLPAPAQDVRQPGKTAVHGKKRTAPVRQAQPTTARGARGSEQWMDRASAVSSSGGGGGY
jgi:hypothetical protein